MVPDKFNMVDLGGIDLIMMQGEAVPGLYDKLMAAISNCQYQCLYNWMFDSVLIPPTYVQMSVVSGEIYLNGGVSVTSDDVIHIYTISPGPTPPAIIPLLAEENGIYNVPVGVDGFDPVTVDVPSYTPVITPLSITENGTYTAPSGVDGYSPITVNVESGSQYIAYRILSVGTGGSNTSVSVQKGIYDINALTPFTPTEDPVTYYFAGGTYTENHIDDIFSLDSYVNNSWNWGVQGISGHTIYLLNDGVYASGVRAKIWYYNVSVDFYIIIGIPQ